MVKHEDERAFPVTMEDGMGRSMSNLGMSLRDYFAAKAGPEDVVEILSEHYDAWCGSGTTRTPEYQQPSRAEARYMFADAMLAERAK